MPMIDPYEAYSDPTNVAVQRQLKVCYGAVALIDTDEHEVQVSVPFGEVDGSPSNNIRLVFLGETLVDAQVKVPHEGVEKVNIPAVDPTDPLIYPVDADRLRYLTRPPAGFIGSLYSIGQRFMIDTEAYILCQGTPRMVSLVGLESGNRWTEGAVVRDPGSITQAEFDRIAGGSRPVLIQR